MDFAGSFAEAGVTLEEVTIFFLALILGFLGGRRDSQDITAESHMVSFWLGFDHGYSSCEQERDEGLSAEAKEEEINDESVVDNDKDL